MLVPAVRGAINIIAGSIATFPLERWRDGRKIDPGTFLAYPEDYRPYSRTMAATVRSLILYPYAWWQVTARDPAGFPSRVRWLDPRYVSFTPVWGTAEIDDKWAWYKGSRVARTDLIPFEGPDMGLLHHGATILTTAIALEEASRTYATPSVPTGYLQQEGQYTMAKPDIEALLDDWEASRKARSTAYLNAGVSYHSVYSTAKDLQLVEAREESARQIGRMLNLPFRYMGVDSGNSMTYSNIASERADFVDLCLSQYMEAISGRLSMPDRNGSLPGETIRYGLDAFLRGAPTDRVARSQVLVDMGVMTRDEARALEGLPGPAPDLADVPALDVEPGADGQAQSIPRNIRRALT